ncbi:CAAX prenyl protease-related protein [Pseudoduganella chitinolytica]|uniref:CAAX prenyl protease-related protein n=1 Tax=Pseudoduganella chitinolytica TaxID=34070 RepID=A0ABY8BI86_9BURK|nr:CAAX prenyl protease-related protein [Pseudoduganella chitinolytica]WEF35686.1 CAAX prenyl protease-related protein [Pseudoduganella chitinolytica]
MTAQQDQPPTPHRAGSTEADTPGFFSRPSTARILPFATYMAFIAIADLLERLGVTAEQLRWLYPVKTIAVVAVLLAYRRHYSELGWRTLRARHIVQAVLVGIVVLVLWLNLGASWMQVGVSAGYNPTGADGRIDWLLVACRIAGAALVVPVMEELFWRSFLMRWLERHDFLHVYPASVGIKALAVTSILFGIEHNLWLAGIVAGIAYSVVYMRSGNLWSAILAHATTNGLLGVWVVATASWTYW